MHPHIHAHTQAHVCMYPHTHVHAAMYMHTHVHMHARMHTPCSCMHTRVCTKTHVHMRAAAHACTCLHAHVCMHIPVCTRTYTHTHGSTTRPLTPCASPRVPSTPPTPVHAQRPCVQTPPPRCCAHGSCCPSHARALTPACKQQPAVHTPVLTPQHLHIHTHTCDSSAHTDTCTDPTAPPQPFESPSKLPLLLNSSSPGSTNQYSSPPPPLCSLLGP